DLAARVGKEDGHERAAGDGSGHHRAELGRIDVAGGEIFFHEGLVGLDDAFDQRGMSRGHVAEVGGAFLVAEAVDHAAALAGGQVHRLALVAEEFLNAGDEVVQIEVGVDLVDDDHPADAVGFGPLHHPAGIDLNAGGGGDDADGRFHAGQGGNGRPGKVRSAGRIHNVDGLVLDGDVGQ